MPAPRFERSHSNISPVIPMLRRSLAVLFAVPLFALPARGQGAVLLCKDGTTTTTTGRGACTGHGGVDKKAAKQAASAAKAEKKSEAKAEKSAQRTVSAPAAAPVAPAAKPATVPARRAAAAARPASTLPAQSAPARAAAATPAAPAPTRAAATMPAAPAPTRTAPAPRAAAPAAARAGNTDPTGATALCKDGTYSRATNHRGACARHQGVAKWL